MLGDVNASLIKTALGRTIIVQHCTNLPRPYSRINIVQGTKGFFEGYPDASTSRARGQSDQWEDAKTRSRNTITRCGRRSPKRAEAPDTAAWTTSRTTG